MKKVVTRLFGGLGNQLFIYAAARRLSIVNNMELRLDITSGFKRDFQFKRKYLLHNFNIKAKFASKIESFDFPGGRYLRFIIKEINKVLPFENRFYITEETNKRFDERLLIFRPKSTIYLEGYWQSEKYFKDIEDVIRNDLKIITSHEEITIKEANIIRNTPNPVCLGIRLYQEYREEKKRSHLVLPVEYYLTAVKIIAERIKNTRFFIFCNDINWVKSNLALRYPHTIITPKPEDERAHEDLWLMSLCKHFIIPNSTYHWWGAWLSENKDKIVIAPKEDFYNKDTIPDEWEKI